MLKSISGKQTRIFNEAVETHIASCRTHISICHCSIVNLIMLKSISGQQTRIFNEAVEQYSQLGLRTLCLAWRELKEDEYEEWSFMFREANSTLVDREVKDTSHLSLCLYLFFLKDSTNSMMNNTRAGSYMLLFPTVENS